MSPSWHLLLRRRVCNWVAFVILAWLPGVSSGADRMDAEFQSWLANSLTQSSSNYFLQPYRRGYIAYIPNGSDVEFVCGAEGRFLVTGERALTGAGARAGIVNSDAVGGMNPGARVYILPPASQPSIRLDRGRLYYKSIDPMALSMVQLGTTNAVLQVLGTEFQIEVEPVLRRTRVHMIQGIATLRSTASMEPDPGVTLLSGDVGEALGDAKPTRTAFLQPITETLQWLLYYPAILDPGELEFERPPSPELQSALENYRKGDLLQASDALEGLAGTGEAELLFRAAMNLGTGNVEAGISALGTRPERGTNTVVSLKRNDQVRSALWLLVDAVALRRVRGRPEPQLASEWLAESYYQQSLMVTLGTTFSGSDRSEAAVTAPGPEPWESGVYPRSAPQLERALLAARRAIEVNTNFGFGWVRKAELEFSFGDLRSMRKSLDKVLRGASALAPAHAQARALDGFLEAAWDRLEPATNAFAGAIAIDPALGNAWLGLGLSYIRSGDVESGLRFLQIASSKEPHRSLLHSYLGKAYYDSVTATGNPFETVRKALRGAEATAVAIHRATNEIALARQLDTGDPTPPLYSALIHLRENRINDSIRDLEESLELTWNRRVYRSQARLEEDAAVRSANLAVAYRDAGMLEWGGFEAGRAVRRDYANYSAHLFLANAYDNLRGTRYDGIRYETATVTEILLADLLAPSGAGPLSRTVSQQEYSRLLSRNRSFGFMSITDVRSTGDVEQVASQYGSIGGTAYSVDALYRSTDEGRPNSDRDYATVETKLRHALTPDDTVLFQWAWADHESGDILRYYDPSQASGTRRVEWEQNPLLLAGYRHQWSPDNQTLFLAGRLDEHSTVRDPAARSGFMEWADGDFRQGADGSIELTPFQYPMELSTRVELWSAELQQVFAWGDLLRCVVGTRGQFGRVAVTSHSENYVSDLGFFPPIDQCEDCVENLSENLNRFSAYGYADWAMLPNLTLSLGLAYDALSFPLNALNPPLTEGTDSVDRVSPKIGLEWEPWDGTRFRGAFTRSLGGFGTEQSLRIEPSQVAGFLQSYRTLIPPGIADPAAGEAIDSFSAAVEQKIGSRTYVSLVATRLESEAEGEEGIYQFESLFPPPAYTDSTSTRHQFVEQSGAVILNQLLGERWSLGARFRISEADYGKTHVDLALPGLDQHGVLTELSLDLRYQSPTGWFFRTEQNWVTQRLPSPYGDPDFVNWNLTTGYRFMKRRAELRLSWLNLLGERIQLSPINLYGDFARERTLGVYLRFEL